MKPELIHQALSNNKITPEVEKLVKDSLAALDEGEIRVCKKIKGQWKVNEWIKEAILLYFKMTKMREFVSGDFKFF